MFVILLALNTIESPTEREIIENIFLDHSRYVKAMSVIFGISEQDSDDVLHTVFLKVIKHRNKFINAETDEVKRLLYIYTKSICIDISKKPVEEIPYSPELFAEQFDKAGKEKPDDFTYFNNRENVQKLSLAVSKLKYPAKEIIQLKYYFNKNNKEIADFLNLSETNVSTILHRSLKKLKKEVGDYSYDE